MRNYKVLNQQVFTDSPYSLVPIRMKDRHAIRQWRNEQMYHLRQNEPLTEEQQDLYFHEVVSPLFDLDEPDQILFSYLEEETCIGYGGLAHINWHNKNAEISFIMDTKLENEDFAHNWSIYLKLIEIVGFSELKLNKLFTYAYDVRPNLYPVLKQLGFYEEARLKEHCYFDGEFIDVVIHSKFR